ncbi:MAG: hypothetical protein HY593_06230 [Candidatus Omnitrophica bacterium]|nr:hypothetical protein [Candidatus Omnitrophota bacterium]
MSRIVKVSALVLAVLTAAVPAFAASTSVGPVTVSASVDQVLTLTVVMKKNNSSGATITSMDFGKLVDVGTGTLRSSATSTTGTGSAVAFITANSSSLPYTITQTGTALTSGVNTLPTGASTVVPVYAAADNGGQGMPGGASLGSAGTWAAANKVIYTSDAAGAVRTIQAGYSITDDPAAGSTAPVPLNQAAGTYTGQVTFTVTA